MTDFLIGLVVGGATGVVAGFCWGWQWWWEGPFSDGRDRGEDLGAKQIEAFRNHPGAGYQALSIAEYNRLAAYTDEWVKRPWPPEPT